MKQSTKDEARGEFHEVKGKIKQKVGQMTKNPRLEGEGMGEKIAGKLQKKMGQLKKAVGK